MAWPPGAHPSSGHLTAQPTHSQLLGPQGQEPGERGSQSQEGSEGHEDLTPTMLCYAKSLQSCPTLCDPIDGSPPGSPVPGILQARTLEWVAISFSKQHIINLWVPLRFS